MEDEYMDGDAENWLYKIDKSTETFVIDGELEKAYYDGVYLIGDINKPASDSNFDVFLTADAENIYVFYEFTKVEGIFWQDGYQYPYHFDCVDFCLNLAGDKAIGKEFRIYANVEGGMDAEGYYDGEAAAAGVSELYVKYTNKGYNVEFAIPLEKVGGMYENGDKMISFTALSTITTAWEDKTAAPSRVYTTALNAQGTLDKTNPSYLVINGTKNEDGPELTEDKCYKFTLNAAAESLAAADTAALKAAATDNGLVFEAAYGNGTANLWNDTNDYTLYVAADADSIYWLFDIKDSNIVNNADDPAVNAASDGSQYWWNDKAEVYIDLNAGADYNASTSKYCVSIYGEAEGTDHYDTAEGTQHDLIKKARTDGLVTKYEVKYVEGGYTVLMVFSRAKIIDNKFSFNAQVALGDIVTPATETTLATYGRNYVAIATMAMNGNTHTKLNYVTIVDPTPAT